MDWYSIFKFLHVAAAVAWVGGGLVLAFLGMSYGARKDDAAQDAVIGHVVFLAMRWFIPASMLTVVFGAITATIGNMWGDAWVILGLVGFAATFCTGNFILKPLSEQSAKLKSEGNTAEAKAVGQKLLDVSKFDYVMLFVVIALMVLKPTWADLVTLGIMAVIVVAAGFIFLPPALRKSAA